jgi:hypothetical protein
VPWSIWSSTTTRPVISKNGFAPNERIGGLRASFFAGTGERLPDFSVSGLWHS